MPDTLTLTVPTCGDALRLARACGYKTGPAEWCGREWDAGTPDANQRLWIDLTRNGERPLSHVTGPEPVSGRYRVRLRLTDWQGRTIEMADPLTVAARLKIGYTLELKS